VTIRDVGDDAPLGQLPNRFATAPELVTEGTQGVLTAQGRSGERGYLTPAGAGSRALSHLAHAISTAPPLLATDARRRTPP